MQSVSRIASAETQNKKGKMEAYAFFEYYIFVLFFTCFPVTVLFDSGPVSEYRSAFGKSFLLCMGRTKVHFIDAFHDMCWIFLRHMDWDKKKS